MVYHLRHCSDVQLTGQEGSRGYLPPTFAFLLRSSTPKKFPEKFAKAAIKCDSVVITSKRV
jgi:hypothetical protein